MEAWNKFEFGHVGKEVARLQKWLEWLELYPIDVGVIQSIRETRFELNCGLEKESLMWKQRAKLHWFKEGDHNMSYFHAKTSSPFLKKILLREFLMSKRIGKIMNQLLLRFLRITTPNFLLPPPPRIFQKSWMQSKPRSLRT